MVTHQIAEQQKFAVPAAVGQPLRFGLGTASRGERLAPVRPGAAPVGRLRHMPLATRVGVPGVEAFAAVDGLTGLGRDSDAARPASGGGAGASGHDDRPSRRRRGATRRQDRTWFGMALRGAKTSWHLLIDDSWQKCGWLNHEFGGLRRTSTNLESENMPSDLQLFRSLTFAGVR